MTEVKINIKPDYTKVIAYYDSLDDKAVLNLGLFNKPSGAYPSVFQRFFTKSTTYKVAETVSHEIIHAVLEKYVSEEASIAFDKLTPALWRKGISIATNRKW